MSLEPINKACRFYSAESFKNTKICTKIMFTYAQVKDMKKPTKY